MNELSNAMILRPAPLWKRGLAQMVDLAIFLPIATTGFYQSALWGHALPFAIAMALTLLVPVVSTALLGGSLGKRLLRLRVVSLGTGLADWRVAWNRHALFSAWVLCSVLAVAPVIDRIGPWKNLAMPPEDFQQSLTGWGVATYVCQTLVWASSLLVLLRPDRRGLHDLWAGTVVVESRTVRSWLA